MHFKTFKNKNPHLRVGRETFKNIFSSNIIPLQVKIIEDINLNQNKENFVLLGQNGK